MRSGRTGDKRHSKTESGRIISRPNPKEHRPPKRQNAKTKTQKRSTRKGHTKAARARADLSHARERRSVAKLDLGQEGGRVG
eukprot:1330685-Prymnesium_polylepis.1